MADALYGPGGYYLTGAGAAGFRTGAASPPFAVALARLADQVDDLLGRPDPFELVDVGAGDGTLLLAVSDAVAVDLGARLRPTGVEVRDRPADLPVHVRWERQVPPGVVGLVLANEWLDVVPVDVVQGGRLVLVDARGCQQPGPPPAPADAAWLDAWWPGWSNRRAEVGRGRDLAWAGVVRRLARGAALAIDYAHAREDRPEAGTLVGYRNGRPVPPVPDGSCDLTAHVALDAAADAAAGAVTSTLLTTQRDALRALGISSRRPPYEGDPAGYLAGLAAASQHAELLDASGLGGFGWLLQTVSIPPPPCIS